MEEKIFVGYGYGRFKNESNGSMQEYCNVFMMEDFYGEQNNDYHFGGHKAVKYKCVSPEVFKDIPFGSRVQCWFNSRGQITDMSVIDKK